jgi:hypothetical protein
MESSEDPSIGPDNPITILANHDLHYSHLCFILVATSIREKLPALAVELPPAAIGQAALSKWSINAFGIDLVLDA